jgi:hypothetical protein
MELAYHFVSDTLRDGRPIPADGEWLEHQGKVVICQSGLHASSHPFDALKYALGKTLCLVEVEGVVARQDDKLVAKRRRIVKRFDAEPLMREFSRWCALQVIELWDAPEVVRQYLTTGDESIRGAAWAAAWAAACPPARDAAWAPAGAAAGAAARGAVRAAARDAAWAAAWPPAVAAAWAAARDAAWPPAGAHARAHARGAALDEQRNRFKKMADAAFEAAT